MTDNTLPITVWMNMPSFYQGDLFRALASLPGVDLHVVFARGLTADRQKLGWEADLDGYKNCTLRHPLALGQAVRIAASRRNHVHIVNAVWAEPAFAAALSALAALGSTYLIYSEASDPFDARSALKLAVRNTFGRAILRRAGGLLAISRLASDFYLKLGMNPEAIYPFGYFRAAEAPPTGMAHRNGSACRIRFVGQLVQRKGIDLLLSSLAGFAQENQPWELTLTGAGAQESALRETASRLGIADRVVFEGVLPAKEIREHMGRSDLLVLPSRWDGWGLVVNEAFSAGVPVIASDRCGAADLIREGANGFVFRSEDAGDLRSRLAQFFSARPAWPAMRQAALATASGITAEKAALYLRECIAHATGIARRRPEPPWEFTNN